MAPGFATHASEYTYFFGFPSYYNMYERNSPVVNVSSHLRLSRGIVDKLVSYIATGDPNTKKGKHWLFSCVAGSRKLWLTMLDS